MTSRNIAYEHSSEIPFILSILFIVRIASEICLHPDGTLSNFVAGRLFSVKLPPIPSIHYSVHESMKSTLMIFCKARDGKESISSIAQVP